MKQKLTERAKIEKEQKENFMEPVDFEEGIRKQLEDREIIPSKGAWDKIETQLTTKSIKKPDNRWLFYAAAAILAGVLVWGGLSKSIEMEEIPLQVVEETVDEKQIQEEIKIPETQIGVTEENINEESVLDIKIEELVSEKVAVIKTNQNEPLQGQSPIEHRAITQDSGTTGIPENLIPAVADKIQEVLLAVQDLEQMQNNKVTDVELDSLLMQARNEILADRILDESNKVDAMALLQEAEYELDRSFRDKVFEALKTGYTKVKTAVADRD